MRAGPPEDRVSNVYYVLKIQYMNKPAETRNVNAPVTTLGRDAGDIVLADPQCSGRHAEIHFVNGQVSVKDLGSTNGTYFNGARNTQFNLAAGQSFTIGQSVMTVMAVHGLPQVGQARTMIAMGGPPPMAPGAGPMGAGPIPSAAAPIPSAVPGPAAFAAAAPVAGGKIGGGAAPVPAGPASGGFGGAPPASGGGFGGPPVPTGGGFGAPIPVAAGPAQMAHQPMGGPPMAGGFGAQPMAQPGMGMAQPGMGGGPMAMPRGEPKVVFSGTGGQFFGQLFVGGLLTAITLGIYFPWFICKFYAFIASKTTIENTAHGTMRVQFRGTGGQLFVHGLIFALLAPITLGLYTPWFICRMLRWITENTDLHGDDGTKYDLKFEGSGAALLGTYIVGVILTMLTLYIYLPWFVVSLRKFVYDNTKIHRNGQECGKVEFVGTGAELLGLSIVGFLLTVVTLGIYMFWFQVNVKKFYMNNTRFHIGQQTITPSFEGTGGEFFVIWLIAALLMPLTLYIYYFWFAAKLYKFDLENIKFNVAGGTGHSYGAGPGQFAPGQPAYGAPAQPGYGAGPGYGAR
jgi:uncharacterized membrane protein YjgN (DUF898 family)